jgi:type I restriction enzyme, S subunit
MDIMTVNKVVPKLRFKEFSENWIQSTFSEISKEFSYGTGSAATKYDGENKYLRITDIDNETRMFKPNPPTSPNCIIQDKYKLKEDDIVFARTGASVGKSYLYNNCDGNLIYAGFLIKMSVNSADSSFIFYETLREKYYKWVSVYSVRSGQPGLNAEELKSYKLYLPDLIEQKKISSFLGALDEKLQQLTKKKELLEDYKKGIMQKIFSQEIRFKDDNGKEYPDWEEKTLGEIGTFKTSSVDKLIKEKEKIVSLINWLNVYNHETITNENTEKLMQVSASERQIETFDLKRGDILFTPSSETPSDIGHSIVIFENLNNTLYSYHLMRFRPTTNINILYSHYFCNDKSVLKQISKLATGSTRFTVSVGSFSKIRIHLPQLGEQKKIADFFTAIDKKIEIVSHQLEKNKDFKKGLLQQMFV